MLTATPWGWVFVRFATEFPRKGGAWDTLVGAGRQVVTWVWVEIEVAGDGALTLENVCNIILNIDKCI